MRLYQGVKVIICYHGIRAQDVIGMGDKTSLCRRRVGMDLLRVERGGAEGGATVEKKLVVTINYVLFPRRNLAELLSKYKHYTKPYLHQATLTHPSWPQSWLHPLTHLGHNPGYIHSPILATSTHPPWLHPLTHPGYIYSPILATSTHPSWLHPLTHPGYIHSPILATSTHQHMPDTLLSFVKGAESDGHTQ